MYHLLKSSKIVCCFQFVLLVEISSLIQICLHSSAFFFLPISLYDHYMLFCRDPGAEQKFKEISNAYEVTVLCCAYISFI